MEEPRTQTNSAAPRPPDAPKAPAGAKPSGGRRGPRKKDGQGDEGVIYVLTKESADGQGLPEIIEKHEEIRDAAMAAFIHTKSGKPYQLYSMQKLEVVPEATDRGFLVTAEPAKSK